MSLKIYLHISHHGKKLGGTKAYVLINMGKTGHVGYDQRGLPSNEPSTTAFNKLLHVLVFVQVVWHHENSRHSFTSLLVMLYYYGGSGIIMTFFFTPFIHCYLGWIRSRFTSV